MKISKKLLIVSGVVTVFTAISLIVSVYFSVLVTSTYKQSYWISGEVFNAFTFVGVGALIGICLYGKKFKHELYAAVTAYMLTLAVVLIVYLVPSSETYLSRELIGKLVPILYIINGVSIVSIIKGAIPFVKKH